METDQDDYICPAIQKCQKSFKTLSEFKDHFLKCRNIQKQTGYFCKYFIGHMCLSQEQLDSHHLTCPKAKTYHVRPIINNNFLDKIQLGMNNKSQIELLQECKIIIKEDLPVSEIMKEQDTNNFQDTHHKQETLSQIFTDSKANQMVKHLEQNLQQSVFNLNFEDQGPIIVYPAKSYIPLKNKTINISADDSMYVNNFMFNGFFSIPEPEIKFCMEFDFFDDPTVQNSEKNKELNDILSQNKILVLNQGENISDEALIIYSKNLNNEYLSKKITNGEFMIAIVSYSQLYGLSNKINTENTETIDEPESFWLVHKIQNNNNNSSIHNNKEVVDPDMQQKKNNNMNIELKSKQKMNNKENNIPKDFEGNENKQKNQEKILSLIGNTNNDLENVKTILNKETLDDEFLLANLHNENDNMNILNWLKKKKSLLETMIQIQNKKYNEKFLNIKKKLEAREQKIIKLNQQIKSNKEKIEEMDLTIVSKFNLKKQENKFREISTNFLQEQKIKFETIFEEQKANFLAQDKQELQKYYNIQQLNQQKFKQMEELKYVNAQFQKLKKQIQQKINHQQIKQNNLEIQISQAQKLLSSQANTNQVKSDYLFSECICSHCTKPKPELVVFPESFLICLKCFETNKVKIQERLNEATLPNQHNPVVYSKNMFWNS